jgi:hypothetical protein
MSALEDYERYLGGFYSIQMMIGYGRRAIPGYGTYFTDRRFIGLGHAQRPSFDKQVPLIPQNLAKDVNDKIIDELDTRKQVEVAKNGIIRVELKMPRLLRQGHLQIFLITGEPVTMGRDRWPHGSDELKMLYFGRERPAEQLENLFRAFDPEALTLL